jgi:hypothetical protein
MKKIAMNRHHRRIAEASAGCRSIESESEMQQIKVIIGDREITLSVERRSGDWLKICLDLDTADQPMQRLFYCDVTADNGYQPTADLPDDEGKALLRKLDASEVSARKAVELFPGQDELIEWLRSNSRLFLISELPNEDAAARQ